MTTSQTFLAVCHIALSQSLVHMALHHNVISLDTALLTAYLQQCGTIIFSPAWGRLVILHCYKLFKNIDRGKSRRSDSGEVMSIQLLCTCINHSLQDFVSSKILASE
jgi:hypothetical protein